MRASTNFSRGVFKPLEGSKISSFRLQPGKVRGAPRPAWATALSDHLRALDRFRVSNTVYSSTTTVIAAPGDLERFSESTARRSLTRRKDIHGELRKPLTVAEVIKPSLRPSRNRSQRTWGRNEPKSERVFGCKCLTQYTYNLLKASRLFRLFAGEKPQPARIYPWEWAGEMRKSWDEFQTISAARETTSRGTKISEQTKQVCLKKGVKVEEPQTTVEQQTTRKIIKP